MLIVAVFAVGLIALRLTGHDLSRLNQLRMRWPWLAIGAVIAQVALISMWSKGWHAGHLIAHLGTYAALGVFLGANRGIARMWVVAVGIFSNAAAIALNGGVMPASRTAMSIAHLRTGPGFANSAAVAHPRLGFLGDIIPTPSWLPLHNVASIGDLLIAGGALLVVAGQTRRAGARARLPKAAITDRSDLAVALPPAAPSV